MVHGTKAVVLTMVVAAALLAAAASSLGGSSVDCGAPPVRTWHTAEDPL
jgi:hypothetical protein